MRFFFQLKKIACCLIIFSLKLRLPVLFRCNICDLYGLWVTDEENTIFDAKASQVAIYCDTFLAVFIVTNNDIRTAYINEIS